MALLARRHTKLHNLPSNENRYFPLSTPSFSFCYWLLSGGNTQSCTPTFSPCSRPHLFESAQLIPELEIVELFCGNLFSFLIKFESKETCPLFESERSSNRFPLWELKNLTNPSSGFQSRGIFFAGLKTRDNCYQVYPIPFTLWMQ